MTPSVWQMWNSSITNNNTNDLNKYYKKKRRKKKKAMLYIKTEIIFMTHFLLDNALTYQI